MASSDAILEIDNSEHGEVNLNSEEQYNLTNMAVTSDNKLLLCNFQESHPKVYIYENCVTCVKVILFTCPPWGITVGPNTDEAVVTLPKEKCIQFINTANNEIDRKREIGEECHGVTTVKDKIYIGGEGKILILNADGVYVREIQNVLTNGTIYHLLYNKRHDGLLFRLKCVLPMDEIHQRLTPDSWKLYCIRLNGQLVYEKDVSGSIGMAVDRKGDVYISGNHTNVIQRFSTDAFSDKVVLREHDGIYKPWGITFNSEFTKLFIINKEGKAVLFYNYR